MINKIKENKHLRVVLIIISAIILGAGVSFAFYAAIINGNETSTTLTLEAGTLSINYDGGDEIVAKGFLPGSTPFASKSFTLTGNNDSKLYMPYTISLVVDLNTFNTGSLKCKISGINNSNNGEIAFTSSKIISGNIMELGKGFFEPSATNALHTYRVDFYFPDDGTDQSDEMKSQFQAHIKIEGAKISQDVPSTGGNLIAGTMASEIVGGNSLDNVDTVTSVTVPGKGEASTNEGLRSAPDDFGTSYYFRGTVDNNYVMLGGICWRIVRIMGDGNIKLTTHDIMGDCSSNSGTGAFYGSETYYYDGSSITPLFNETNAYAKLAEFYEALSEEAKSKIVDSIWCSDYTKDGDLFIGDQHLVNGTPSFICSDGPSDNPNLYRYSSESGTLANGNQLLPYSIGLLTVDELMYAGATSSYTPTKLFLQQNAFGAIWATMSPGVDYGSLQIEFVWDNSDENSGGGIDAIAYTAADERFYIRPAIVIDGKVSFSGSGTATDPYVVE